MATAIATLPVHWTHAWALLGEWANHITFPLPKAAPDGKIVWPRHGSADLLGQTYQTRSPPFVMWAFPANKVLLLLWFFFQPHFLSMFCLVTSYFKVEHQSTTKRPTVIGIQANQCAFCAILKDGDTLVWRDHDAGGLWNGQIRGPCDVCAVQSTERAFAALTSHGSVIAWGDLLYGGCMKEVIGK